MNGNELLIITAQIALKIFRIELLEFVSYATVNENPLFTTHRQTILSILSILSIYQFYQCKNAKISPVDGYNLPGKETVLKQC